MVAPGAGPGLVVLTDSFNSLSIFGPVAGSWPHPHPYSFNSSP